jgi:hypothetical protein
MVMERGKIHPCVFKERFLTLFKYYQILCRNRDLDFSQVLPRKRALEIGENFFIILVVLGDEVLN